MSSHQIRVESIALANSTTADRALMTIPEHAMVHDVSVALDAAITAPAVNESANVSVARGGVMGSIGALGQSIINAITIPVADPWMLAPSAQGPFVYMNDTLFFRWSQGATGLAFPGGVVRLTLGARYAPGPARPRAQVHLPATAGSASARTAYVVNVVDEPCRILYAYFVPDSLFLPTQPVLLGLTMYRNQGTLVGGDQQLGILHVSAGDIINAGQALQFLTEAEYPVSPGDVVVLTYTQGGTAQALPSGHLYICFSNSLDARDIRPQLVAHSRYTTWASGAGTRNEQIISVVERPGYLTAIHLAVDGTATMTNAANLYVNLKKHRGMQVGADGVLGTFAFTAGQVLTQGQSVHGQVAYPIVELQPGDVIYASYLQGASGQSLTSGAITLDVEPIPVPPGVNPDHTDGGIHRQHRPINDVYKKTFADEQSSFLRGPTSAQPASTARSCWAAIPQ